VSRDAIEIVLLALGYSGMTALLGLLVVRFGPRSIRANLVEVSLIAVLSVVIGVLGASRAMFLSGHDLGVVLLVTLVAAVVASTVSWLLGRRVVGEVREVRAHARALGGHVTLPSVGPVAPLQVRELEDIRDELVSAGDRLTAGRAREQALEHSRRELVAWVSHDLRTPLAGLRAMAEALEDGVAPEPARYHRQIRREVDRLSRLVDDLFELSRIRSGGLALTLEDVDLQALIADVVSGSTPMAEAGGVALGGSADPVPVRADIGGLGRALTNLVVNAIRHTPSDGTVRVVGHLQGDEVVLSVSDGCGGIPAAELDQLFEPGWRSERARTPQPDRPDGGAGLGLAIARGIVEAHQGRISVRNTAVGCCFDVHLPALDTA